MVKLYVLFDIDGMLTRVSNIFGTGIEVICNIPIDFNKLQGYEIVNNELIFNEDKYNVYLKLVKEQEEYEKTLVEFNKYAQENILPSLDGNIANNFISLYPTYEVGVTYKVGDMFNYNGKLYKVIQTHTSQVDWIPNIVQALYKEVK